MTEMKKVVAFFDGIPYTVTSGGALRRNRMNNLME
jgi:hypothetical protein